MATGGYAMVSFLVLGLGLLSFSELNKFLDQKVGWQTFSVQGQIVNMSALWAARTLSPPYISGVVTQKQVRTL